MPLHFNYCDDDDEDDDEEDDDEEDAVLFQSLNASPQCHASDTLLMLQNTSFSICKRSLC